MIINHSSHYTIRWTWNVNVLDHLVSRKFHRINTKCCETALLPKTKMIEKVRQRKEKNYVSKPDFFQSCCLSSFFFAFLRWFFGFLRVRKFFPISGLYTLYTEYCTRSVIRYTSLFFPFFRFEPCNANEKEEQNDGTR